MFRHAWVLTFLCLGTAAAAAEPYADLPLPRKNYLNNGSFERGSEGWAWFAGRDAGGVVQEGAHSGRACLRVTGAIDDYRYYEQDVPLTPGRTYTLSAWLKCSGFRRAGANGLAVNVVNYGWTKGFSVSPLKPDEEWTRHAVTFEAPPTQEMGGRPHYRIIVFWPVKCEGTLWVDDVQVEEGDHATEFTDSTLGWALDALAAVRAARQGAEDARTALTGLPAGSALAAGLEAQAQGITAQADALAQRLRDYAGLASAQARALLAEARALQKAVSQLRFLYFLGDPYLPLPEVPLPAAVPRDLSLAWTCFSGEKRAVALNVANLTGRSSTCRVVPGDLTDVGRGARLAGTPWVTVYTVPEIRGSVKRSALFTDPLPRADEAGLVPIRDRGLSQAILLVDTSRLLPGRYRGTVDVMSLTDAEDRHRVDADLTVLPVRLASLEDLDIAEVGLSDEYARESTRPLGINTFTIPPQWVMPEPSTGGGGTVWIDTSRLDVLVKDRLARCPRARFHFCFGAGAAVGAHLVKACGLRPETPAFRAFAAGWVRTLVAHFRALGVEPGRLIFETVDEPGTGQLAEAVRWAEILKAAAPGVQTQSYVTSFTPDDEACARLYETHTITAPGFTCINEQAVAYLKARGRKVWVYDCQNSAETFHPVAYYRLLPWLAWRYGLDGWGHFSWLASERDRGYVPWEGVAEESLVYPATSCGQVISRRWLALLAGTQDYQALRALKTLAEAVPKKPGAAEAVPAAQALLTDLPGKALAMLKPGREYFTSLAPDADAAVLDRFREQLASAASGLAAKAGPAPSLRVGLQQDGAALVVEAPRASSLAIRYLCGHRLPWRSLEARVAAGKTRVPLRLGPCERVTRCLVAAAGDDGRVAAAAVPPIARVGVESTVPPYEPDRLNDGLAMPGMKFEPEYGWISGAAATEHWVTLSFDAPAKVQGVRLWWMTFYGLPRAYRVQAWSGGAWKEVPGLTGWRPARAAIEEVRFPPITTSKLRVLQRAGGGNPTFPNLMGLSEVEAF